MTVSIFNFGHGSEVLLDFEFRLGGGARVTLVHFRIGRVEGGCREPIVLDIPLVLELIRLDPASYLDLPYHVGLVRV